LRDFSWRCSAERPARSAIARQKQCDEEGKHSKGDRRAVRRFAVGCAANCDGVQRHHAGSRLRSVRFGSVDVFGNVEPPRRIAAPDRTLSV
jgi:hypothetical protein